MFDRQTAETPGTADRQIVQALATSWACPGHPGAAGDKQWTQGGLGKLYIKMVH